jgi:hypothetical protein
MEIGEGDGKRVDAPQVKVPRWLDEHPEWTWPQNKENPTQKSLELLHSRLTNIQGREKDGVYSAKFEPKEDAPEGTPTLIIERPREYDFAYGDFMNPSGDGFRNFYDSPNIRFVATRIRGGIITEEPVPDDEINGCADKFIYDLKQTSGFHMFR